MGKWRLMKTAPRDGSHILLATREARHTMINWKGRRVFAGYFQTQGNDWVLEGNWASQGGMKPVCWQPLPEAHDEA